MCLSNYIINYIRLYICIINIKIWRRNSKLYICPILNTQIQPIVTVEKCLTVKKSTLSDNHNIVKQTCKMTILQLLWSRYCCRSWRHVYWRKCYSLYSLHVDAVKRRIYSNNRRMRKKKRVDIILVNSVKYCFVKMLTSS